MQLLYQMKRTFVYGLLTNLEDAILIKVSNVRSGNRRIKCSYATMKWLSPKAPADGLRVLLRLGN
jgi:DNA-binding PadR family transcriptional regulator